MKFSNSLSLFVALAAVHVVRDGPVISDCGYAPADVIFLLDQSGSLGLPNFNREKEFVLKFAESLPIGPHDVQIGVVIFATTVHTTFTLDEHADAFSLMYAIRNIQYQSGATSTYRALNFVRDHGFSPSAGDRADVPNILIVLTDGQSTDPRKTILAADALKNENVEIFAIGIGHGINRNELKGIASDDRHVFSATTHDALHTLQTELQMATCLARTPTTPLHNTVTSPSHSSISWLTVPTNARNNIQVRFKGITCQDQLSEASCRQINACSDTKYINYCKKFCNLCCSDQATGNCGSHDACATVTSAMKCRSTCGLCECHDTIDCAALSKFCSVVDEITLKCANTCGLCRNSNPFG